MSSRKICDNTVLHYITIFAVCLVSYGVYLNGEFVFDDSVAIVKNTDVINHDTSIFSIFSHDFWGFNITDPTSHKSYRPLTTLSFRLEHKLFGLSAYFMKITNFVLHTIVTYGVYFLYSSVLCQEEISSFLGTLLFAAHPIHTEAVAGVVGRAELLCAFVFLVTVSFYCLFFANEKNWSLLAIITFFFFYSILCVIALLCKENGITILPMCAICDILLHTNLIDKFKLRTGRLQISSKIISRILILTIIFVILIYMRMRVMQFKSPTFKEMDNPVAASENFFTKMMSQSYLYTLNFWLLLCPDWLSFDWALGSIDLVESMTDIRLIFVVIFFLFLLTFIWCASQKLLLGISFMIVPFLPACGMIKLGFVIAERILYIPSIGFCLIVTIGFNKTTRLFKTKLFKFICNISFVLLIAIFILKTQQRSKEWTTEELLFTSALRVCPNNAKVHYNIARLATDKNQKDKAFYYYHRAIKLYPGYESAIMNLGNLYREIGDFLTAEKYLKRSIELLEEFPAAWMNLGIVQASLGKYEESLKSYKKAIQYRKRYPTCYYNLGNLFIEMKNYSMALQSWQEAISLNPKHAKAWANILALFDNKGQVDDVIKTSNIALQYIPNDPPILFSRANAFGKLGNFEESERLFLEIIKIRPKYAIYYANLGVLYHRWNKIEKALEFYKKALNIDPNLKSARENLLKLQK